MGTAAAALSLSSPAVAFDAERTSLDARERAMGPVAAAVRGARAGLRKALGTQGLVAVDEGTGATRVVARLNGFLTRPSVTGAGEVARRYVRDHMAVFGLDADDVDALRLVRRNVSPGGIEHVVWAQTYRGIPSVDSALRANVSEDGRLINVLGPAQPDLSVPSTTPRLGAAQAAAAAARGLREREGVRPLHEAADEHLVIYRAGTANRLAWRLLMRVSPTEVYDAIVDATTGEVVRRVNRVSFATALVHDNYPGAPAGGTATSRTIPAAWLDLPATRLRGPYAHAVSDVDDRIPGPMLDNFTPMQADEVAPQSGDAWSHPRTPFSPAGGNCPAAGCAWNLTAGSWSANRAHAATQVFWFVNTFRDHLAAAPVGFTAASGGFEGADPVIAQVLDGANIAAGLPDADHVNNASMVILPDGRPGLMQMHLWAPPFRAVDGADDASIVYHEYAHGLTTRLVTDAEGFGALWTNQAAAMGEGWSDWYAMDYLASPRGGTPLVVDGPGQGDVRIGVHPDEAAHLLRYSPMDCAVGDAANCPGHGSSGAGGYTYGDLGRIEGIPEPHADGEIWGQTLWQLRQALIAAHGEPAGVERARRYITDALRLSPDNPSFLDMRNAILQADTTAAGGDRALIWQVFASRGMGYFAATGSSSDPAPVESFALPPAPGGPTGIVHGTVYDDRATPQGGARIAFSGHDTGLGQQLAAISAADGTYRIDDVPVGTYPLLHVRPAAAGLVGDSVAGVTVAAGVNTRDWTVRRNVAASALGAAVVSFTGSDASALKCGPGSLIDGDQNSTWSTDSPRYAPPGGLATGPKEIVVRLSQPTDVRDIRLDPAAGCGDGVESSLGRYAVDVSTTGLPATFAQVAAGTFTWPDNWRMNPLTLSSTPGGVTHVRLRAIDTQAANNTDKGFMDVSEMQVFGPVVPAPPTPPLPVPAPAGRAPAVKTGAASGIGATVARLAGTVDPNGSSTTYHFQYGTSPAFGRRTPDARAGAGDDPVAVTATIGSLSASTTYHYRLVASGAGGTVRGERRTFKTTRRQARATISSARTIRVSRSGSFSFRVTFGADVRVRPHARVTVTAGRRIASRALAVRPGRRVTARVRLTRAGRALLQRRRRVTAAIRVSARSSTGSRFSVTRRVRLVAR